MAAKSSLEAEKSAFDAQRQQDVVRLKVEAEQLDHKLKEVDLFGMVDNHLCIAHSRCK